MHEVVRDNLESYLAGAAGDARTREVESHLHDCSYCRSEVGSLREQQALLRTLRPVPNFEPRPGFYARVIDQIDRHRRPSFWYGFLEPAFAKRLAYASVALLVLFGGFLVTSADDTSLLANEAEPAVVFSDETASTFGEDPARDRQATFANLASFRE